jgi:simple sugar transport system substrate-binding protein
MKSLKKSLLSLTAAVAGGALSSPAVSRASEGPRYVFAVITHGQPGDTFWDVIRKGAQAAAKDIRKGAQAAAAKDNFSIIWLANPTGSGESQLVTNVFCNSMWTASRSRLP